MSDNNGTPAGWYPNNGGERYWDGTAWTEQTRPVGQPQSAPVAYAQPPVQQPKQKHTLRWVLLTLVLLFVLFVGGCFAILAVAGNEVSKSIDESLADEAANDKPTVVAEGAAFEHDGYSAAEGWKVAPEEFGGVTIEGLTLTLTDDQGVTGGGRSALLTFRLYDGKTVLAEITCSTNEMQEGETSKADCFSGETENIRKWETIKVADAF